MKPHIYSEDKTTTSYKENDGWDYRCAGCGPSISTSTVTRYYCSECFKSLPSRGYKYCPNCGIQFTGRYENRTLKAELHEISVRQRAEKKAKETKERAEYERLKAKFG